MVGKQQAPSKISFEKFFFFRKLMSSLNEKNEKCSTKNKNKDIQVVFFCIDKNIENVENNNRKKYKRTY